NGSGPRTARPARARSAAAVARARIRGEEERHVVVTRDVVNDDLELDAPEERRGRVEDEPVGRALERPGREFRDPAVLVRHVGGEQLVPAVELDANAACRLSVLRVEDMGRDHSANLTACRRCSRAISSSSAWTRWPSRTISPPPT